MKRILRKSIAAFLSAIMIIPASPICTLASEELIIDDTYADDMLLDATGQDGTAGDDILSNEDTEPAITDNSIEEEQLLGDAPVVNDNLLSDDEPEADGSPLPETEPISDETGDADNDGGETEELLIDGWAYELSANGKNIILKHYRGDKRNVIVEPSYKIGKKSYKTVLQGFDVYEWHGEDDEGEFDDSYRIFPADTETVTIKKGVTGGESLRGLFAFCRNLKKVDIKNLNTASTVSMRDMFYWCESLEEIDMSGMKVNKVKDMSFMFHNCKEVLSINFDKWDLSGLEEAACMFQGCENVKKLDFSKINMTKLVNMEKMFINCSRLVSIYFNGKKKITPKNTQRMLAGCSSLVSADLSSIDMKDIESYDGMLGAYFDNGSFAATTRALSTLHPPINIPKGVMIDLPSEFFDNETYANSSVLPQGVNRSIVMFRNSNEKIAVTGLSLQESLNLTVGDTATLTAQVIPATAANRKVSWQCGSFEIISMKDNLSDDNSTVSIRALRSGTTVVSAHTDEGFFGKSCTITVSDKENPDDPDDPEEPEKPIEVENLKLSTHNLPITSGQTKYLMAIVSPDNATDKDVHWSCSGSGVSIEPMGCACRITAGRVEGMGTSAYITASCGGESAECLVEVTSVEISKPVYDAVPEGIYATIFKGGSINMFELTGYPKGYSKEGFGNKIGVPDYPNTYFFKGAAIFYSTDKSVKVERSGKVTGVKGGTAIVQYGQMLNAHGRKDWYSLKRDKKILVLEPSVNNTNVTLDGVGTVFDGANNVTTGVCNLQPDYWSSSNTAVATVDSDSGIVTAVSGGKAEITAYFGGQSVSFKVTVKAPSVKISKTSATVLTGSSLKLSLSGAPKNSSVYWAVSDPKVAKVDQKGLVEPIGAGIARVTAVVDDMGYSCEITVPEPMIKDVEFNAKKVGAQVAMVLDPATTKYKATDFKWSSSDENIAKPAVDKNGEQTGKIIGVTYGVAVITGVCKHNPDLVVQAEVCIPVLQASEVTVIVGRKKDIKPAKLTDATINGYISSDPGIVLVTANGEAYAAGFGTATVYAIVELDDEEHTVINYPCIVTIPEPQFKESTIRVKRGKSQKVEFDTKTCLARFGSFDWEQTQGDYGVVDFDEDKGIVTGRSFGTVTYTGTRRNIEMTFTVEVE